MDKGWSHVQKALVSQGSNSAMQPVSAATDIHSFLAATECNDWSDLDDEFDSDLTTAGCNILLESNSSNNDNRIIEASKKRKMFRKRTDLSCHTTVLVGEDDGYSWRKYGQKHILGSKCLRSYYRCAYKFTQGCSATKQVQRIDDDTLLHKVTYIGKHSCFHVQNDEQKTELVQGSNLAKTAASTCAFASSHSLEESDGSRQASKKRNMLVEWTHEMKASARDSDLPHTQASKSCNQRPASKLLDLLDPRELPIDHQAEGTDRGHQIENWHWHQNVLGLHDDGYRWKKYGQKDILGSKFPRSYYRCAYWTEGCLAKRQVQRIDDDTLQSEITYRGKHTCVREQNDEQKPESIQGLNWEKMTASTCTSLSSYSINQSDDMREASRKRSVSMEWSEDSDMPHTQASESCNQIVDQRLDTLEIPIDYGDGGTVALSMEIRKIAKEIVRACGNDPHLLGLMSSALRDVWDMEIWEYALHTLSLQHASCRDTHENLQVNVLNFCIELLEDDSTMECLRSFALQRKNDAVARESLVDSWITEGILVTRDEGEKVIRNLLDAKFLNLSDNGELLKLLDVEQRVMDIIFQEKSEFLMQGGLGLVEPPEIEEWERAKVICLMDNDLSELPKNPRCPLLLTLFLQRNLKLRRLPASFFSQMPALEVLNLSRTRISSLPDSLFELVSLKRLFLNECILMRKLSPKVKGLKDLEVLDLEGTKLTEMPEEIKQLIKLTCLEVSLLKGRSTPANGLIPSGALSTLSLLEELNIDVGLEAEWWDSYAEGVLDEICSLHRLTSLKFYFPNVELLRKFKSSSLKHFRITVGRDYGRIMARSPTDIRFELERWDRYLKYTDGEGIHEDLLNLLKQAEAFFLDRHSDLKRLSDFGIENLWQLRCCVLGECNEIQVLIDTEDFMEESDEMTLGTLEYLHVYYMKSLETIWRGPMQKTSLSCLKSLTLKTCPELISLFTQEQLDNLRSLEELTVEDCPSLKSLMGRIIRPIEKSGLGERTQTQTQANHARDRSYHLVVQYSEMGEGTLGQVLECWDRENKEMVAIKIVRPISKYPKAAMMSFLPSSLPSRLVR
ncbi:hypothetical protein SAY86_023644 [Trapa natans]|uniref:WRKY domain-containing protein n=1 Tax=Trapa natans TaxID=22666 RepID=A0AAN7LW41_TRANT|nr:hypothetical protein SAY86_023644 [Trapa natans]